MTLAWMRGAVAALGLGLAGAAAEAAVVTDATFDAAGTYTYDDGALALNGSFTAALLGDPDEARDYSLGIDISLLDTPVLAESVFLGTFEIADVVHAVVSHDEFGPVLSFLASATSGVTYGPNSIAGDFSFGLDRFQSAFVLDTVCRSIFVSAQECTLPQSGAFGVSLALTYEAPDAAPVPLPAGLPLLVAGLAGLAGLRRLRR